MKKYLVSLSLVLGLVLSPVLSVPLALAANVSSQTDTMSSNQTSVASSHVIKFVSPTGANNNTDTIIVTFPSDFNFTSKTIGTLSFSHGASTGLETAETLAAAADGTNWGAVFSGTQNRVLTLSTPTDGVGAAELFPNDTVVVTYNSTNSINPTAAGLYTIAISGTFGDSGNIVVPVVAPGQVAVSATVSQSLTFSLGSNSINLGTLDSTLTKSATHTMNVATNATGGMAVTVAGNTLTSGANTITAMSPATTSTTGTEQFGINLKANTVPSVGSNATGSAPIAVASAGYNTADTFKFLSGDSIASSTAGINDTTFTVSYIANIAGTTDAGAYGTTLTYTATATF